MEQKKKILGIISLRQVAFQLSKSNFGGVCLKEIWGTWEMNEIDEEN